MNMDIIEVNEILSLCKCQMEYLEYFDLDGVFWYDYEFICRLLGEQRPSIINNYYRRNIDSNNKNEFKTHNRRYGDRIVIKRFVTTDVVIKLINHNSRNDKYVMNEILSNEANTKGTLFSEFAHDLSNLGDNPIDDMFIIHEIHESDYFKEMREKYDPSYNVNVEKAVDDYREILRELDGEEFEELDVKVVTKRDEYTDKEREIKYKRMKESGKKFEAPSWLREIIK